MKWRLFLLFVPFLSLLHPGCVSFDASPGKRLIRKRCTACHSTARIYKRGRGLEEWTRVVDRMVAHGARLEKGEREQIIEFLASRYPAEGGQ